MPRGHTRRGAEALRYRGPDRRATAAGPGVGRSWLPAGLVLLGLLAVLGLRALDPAVVAATRAVHTELHVAGLVLALVTAPAAVRVWRVTGDVRGARLATAAALQAAASVAVLVAPDPASGPGPLRMTLAVVTAAVVWRAAWGPAVDTAASHLRELAVTALAAGALWSAVGGIVLASPGEVTLGALAAAQVVLAAVWVAVALGALLRALGAASHLLGWIAWTAVAFALAEIAHALALLHPGRGFTFAAASLTASGLVLAAAGTVTGLARAATTGRAQLHRVVEDSRERERERHAASQERAHEVRGALVAIEGATLTLQRHRDHLPEPLREGLTAAVVHELAQLRELLADTPGARPAGRFRPADVVREQAALAAARGLTVDLGDLADAEVRGDVAAGIRIVGNLMRNAEQHGRSTDGRVVVAVEVVRRGGEVVIAVRDHGPGLPAGAAAVIFERGTRLDDRTPGEGLGLHLARCAARALGGDLTAGAPLGGGARFVATLPAATPASDDGPRRRRPQLGRHVHGRARDGGAVAPEPVGEPWEVPA